jgi:uncharacterized membrane protein YkvA (DUF1232 family)
MKSFDELMAEDIAFYEGRHDDLIFQAPAFYRLMVHLLDDPRLPARLRPLVLATIAYFILPVDVYPEDLHGPYGYIDDISLCAFTADDVRRELGSDAILTENWDGEAPILELIGDILAEKEDVLGEDWSKVLKYIDWEQLKGLGTK